MEETMPSLRRPLPLFGFLAGLLTGLALAAIAAVYLTSAPLPFVNKVTQSTDKVTPDAADPNRPLFSPHIPTAQPGTPAAAEAPAGPAPAPGAAPGPGGPAVGTAAAAPAEAAPALAVPGAMASGAAAASGEGARLMLQVGAYKNADDADAARARLALLGLDGKVTEVQLDGNTLYRVRLGPYGALDDLNGIRRTLSENGMEPQLVHAR
jgi:cell division protein FtsN